MRQSIRSSYFPLTPMTFLAVALAHSSNGTPGVEPGMPSKDHLRSVRAAHVQRAVHARGEEPALRHRRGVQVHDVQDIAVTAAEREAVRIEWHDVRAARRRACYALIDADRIVQSIAGVGDV